MKSISKMQFKPLGSSAVVDLQKLDVVDDEDGFDGDDDIGLLRHCLITCNPCGGEGGRI